MLLPELCQEIRLALEIHRCRHKACDCYKAKDLLAVLEALARVSHPWNPDLIISSNETGTLPNRK